MGKNEVAQFYISSVTFFPPLEKGTFQPWHFHLQTEPVEQIFSCWLRQMPSAFHGSFTQAMTAGSGHCSRWSDFNSHLCHCSWKRLPKPMLFQCLLKACLLNQSNFFSIPRVVGKKKQGTVNVKASSSLEPLRGEWSLSLRNAKYCWLRTIFVVFFCNNKHFAEI